MKYSDKLRDPRWQKKRLEVMERDSFTCLACGDSKSTLNVHHKEYHGDPWNAPMGSLETLCESCHTERTAFNKFVMLLPTEKAKRISGFLIMSEKELSIIYRIYCLNHYFHHNDPESIFENKRPPGDLTGDLLHLFTNDWDKDWTKEERKDEVFHAAIVG